MKQSTIFSKQLTRIRGKSKLIESTDTFDYNDMVLDSIESNVMGDLRTWRKTDTIMENKDAYNILKKCDKTVESYMKKCDKELRKLK